MTDRERKAVVVGAIVLILGVLARAVPPIVDNVSQLRAEASDAVELSVRAEGVVASIPALRDSLSSRAVQIVSLAPLIVASGTRAEGVAAMGAMLQGWAESYKVVIGRMESARDSSAAGFMRLSLELDLEGDLEGLTMFLARIERDRQLLSIDRISVENVGTTAAGAQSLRSNLRVNGWIMPAGGS